jgi:hypothetical protein
LSALLANNEDPWNEIYKPRGIEEEIYQEDLQEDAYIVELQSSQGHWLVVPYRYILSYPSTDGVPYRSVMVTISLPALPVDQDLTALMMDLDHLASGQLGISALVQPVETSKTVLIARELHETKMLERQLRKNQEGSIFTQNVALRKRNAELEERLKALETYVASRLA